MVGEVNKIIYNMLISGRGVYLPEVGSLFIERQGARRISKDKLLSPRNVVTYSTQEQAPSLVSEIVNVAGCTQEQAQDIYERWLGKTREGNSVTIGGVGVLNHRSFSTEAAFGAAINPKGVKTLVVRRRSNGWLYAICAVCVLIALGFFGYIMWGDDASKSVKSSASTTTVAATSGDATTAGAAPADSLAVAGQNATSTDASATAATATAATATTTTQSATAPTAANQQAKSATSYAHYVVMGIFSTDKNAEMAVAQVKSKISDAECVVLPFKNKFMVTIYGSNSRSDCAAYAKSYRDVYPDLWIYDKK